MCWSKSLALLAFACICPPGSSAAFRPILAERPSPTANLRSPLSKPELPWVRKAGPEQAKGVIIFVHGVLGNPQSTWSNGDVYWPSLLTGDKAFDGQDIYVFGYPSSKVEKSLSVDELSENLRLALSSDGVLRYKQMSFVSHSMGGLITRAFILKYQTQVASKIRLLYFFATPTTGSPYAQLAKLISRNPQFGQLFPMDADNYLGTLQSNWLAANLKLRSYCAYETRTILGQLIVERQSATNLCTEHLDPIDANHIDIVKPSGTTSIPYRALKAAFEETAPAPPPIASTAQAARPQARFASIDPATLQLVVSATLETYRQETAALMAEAPKLSSPKSTFTKPETLFGSVDRATLRFGVLLGWQLARFEFIDGSEFPEAQAAAPALRSDIIGLLTHDGYPLPSGVQGATDLITAVLAHYSTTDVNKHGAVLVGIAAFRMSLVGASSNSANNQELEHLAASAVDDVDPHLIPHKNEFVRALRQRQPKTTTEVLALLDSIPRN